MLSFLKNWNKKTPKTAQTIGDASLIIGTLAGVAAVFIPGVPILLSVAAVAGGAGKIISKLFAVDPTEDAVKTSETIKDIADVVTELKNK